MFSMRIEPRYCARCDKGLLDSGREWTAIDGSTACPDGRPHTIIPDLYRRTEEARPK